MAERLRFRLPWLKPATARPVTEPQPLRPPVETTQAPGQPSTGIPVQQPPFQPLGIAPAPVQISPPQSDQAPQPTKFESTSSSAATIETLAVTQPASTSQKPSPPHIPATPPSTPLAPAESLVTSQPTSPMSASPQSRAASVPSSPSQATNAATVTSPPHIPAPPSPPLAPAKSQVTSQPASPMRAGPQSRAASVPPSPSRVATATAVTSQPASPSRAASQSRATSVPPSPSRAITESRLNTQPASPSRAAPQSKATSLPPSPSQAITESRLSTQSASPSRKAPQLRAASVPPSPSRTNLQPQSPSRVTPQRAGQANSQPPSPSQKSPRLQQTVSQSQSPLKSSQPTAQETLLLSSISTQPPPSASDQAAMASIDALSKSQKQIETNQASNSGKTSAGPETTVSSLRSDAKTVDIDLPASASNKEAKTGEEKKVEEDLIREGKTVSSATEKEEKEESKVMLQGAAPESSMRAQQQQQPKNTSHLEQDESKVDMLPGDALESSVKAQQQPKNTSHLEQRVQVKEDAFERKKKLTAGFNNKKIKSVRLTHSKANHLVSGSHQSPVMLTLTGQDVSLHKEIKEDISKFVHKLGTGIPNQPGEMPISVVTVAGENRGAFMHLGSEPSKTDGPIHIHRGYKTNPDDNPEATTTDAEENSQKWSMGPSNKQDSPVQAYINSNAQSINNSLLFGSSINEENPGVRMTISYNPEEPPYSSTKLGPPSTHKAEFNVTPAEKLTYEPTVRRRCLRGLFLESSDSEPDNPEKPRRHGCRYVCGAKNKDKDIE